MTRISHQSWAPVLWCLLAAALFGASTPASKALLEGMGPLPLAGLLYLGAAVAVLPFSVAGGAPTTRWTRRNLGHLAGAVLFGGVLGPVLLLYGLQLAPSASVSLWLNLETVATAVVAWAFFKENVGTRVWLANLGVVAAGLILCAPDGFALAPAAGLVALACICWGLDNNHTAVIDGFTPAQTTLAKGLVAGTVNLGLGVVMSQQIPGLWMAGGAMALGALAYGASILLYIQGAQHLGATRSQMLFSTAPFLGVLAAWAALGEPIQGVQVLAGVVLIAAIGAMLTAPHQHAHHHAPQAHTHRHRHDDGHHDHTHPEPVAGWHTHEHQHPALSHTHSHQPDLHHRHEH